MTDTVVYGEVMYANGTRVPCHVTLHPRAGVKAVHSLSGARLTLYADDLLGLFDYDPAGPFMRVPRKRRNRPRWRRRGAAAHAAPRA